MTPKPNAPSGDLRIPLSIQLRTPGTWWVLIMDGGQARLFVREGRRAAFEERAGLLVDDEGEAIAPRESGHHHGRYEKTEHQFAERVAWRIETLAGQAAFDHLVIFAAPAVLGVLRSAMGPKTLSRLRFSKPADLVGEPAAHILERLEA